MVYLFDLIIKLPNLIMLVENGLFLDALAFLQLGVLDHESLWLLVKLFKIWQFLSQRKDLLVTILPILNQWLLEALDYARTFILLQLIFFLFLSEFVLCGPVSLLKILELIDDLISLSSGLEKLQLLLLELILELCNICKVINLVDNIH